MERDPLSGRYCGECGGLHPAEEGDFWAESSLLGLKITYFAMMEGKIYDITGGCCLPEPPNPADAAGRVALRPTGWPDWRARVSWQNGPAASAWGSPRTPTASPTTSPSAPGPPGRPGGRGRSQQQSGAGEGARARSWGGSQPRQAPPTPALPPQERLQGQPLHRCRPAGLLHPRLSGELRTDAWGALPAAPRPPGACSLPRGPPQGRGHSPQGRHEAQEAEEDAAAVPALSGAGAEDALPGMKRALLNKKKSIFLFFFF